MERERDRLGLVDRNDLVFLAGFQADRVRALRARNSHIERIDDLAVIGLVFFGLCPCVDAFTLFQVRGALVVAVGRDNAVCTAAGSTFIRDLRKVKVHLDTCSTRITLDRPVDFEALARFGLINIIFCALFLSGIVCFPVGDKIVNKRIGSLRCHRVFGTDCRKCAEQ